MVRFTVVAISQCSGFYVIYPLSSFEALTFLPERRCLRVARRSLSKMALYGFSLTQTGSILGSVLAAYLTLSVFCPHP
jgi:hypothetical protein